jgi:hypothetical protein
MKRRYPRVYILLLPLLLVVLMGLNKDYRGFLSPTDSTGVRASLRSNSSAPGGPLSFPTSLRFRSEQEKHDNVVFYNYLQNRSDNFHSWFAHNKTDVLHPNADDDGPILDFMIAGFAKCGTTTMEANLGTIAPMPIGDVCTPVHQTVYYSHINWPKQYDPNGTKPLRGSKCPMQIDNLQSYSQYLPRTKMIVGIRHPVLGFASFWNMQAGNYAGAYRNISPYNLTQPCTHRNACRMTCARRQLVCVQRFRFHVFLAQLGKTPLSETERVLLAPNDFDGGTRLPNHQIRNPVFLYEQTELNEDYLWKKIARYLNYEGDMIRHDQYQSSHGKTFPGANIIDICEAQYDEFRRFMMPYAYEMSVWICDYFVTPGSGVEVGDRDRFCEMVRDYKNDPCGRLIHFGNGTYALPRPI